MSEVSKPHSELGSKVREGLQLYLDDVCPEGDWFDAYFAALDSLEEQFEALRGALVEISRRGEEGGRLCDTSYGMWRIAHETLAREALLSNPASSPVTPLPVCRECAKGNHIYCLDDGSSTVTCRCTCGDESRPASEPKEDACSG